MQKKHLLLAALLFLTIFLCFAVSCGNNAKDNDQNHGQQPEAEEELEFSLKNGSYAVIGYNGNSPSVIIPDNKDGIPVTEISDDAFRDAQVIVSLTLPDTLRIIGNGAFYGCAALTDLTLPDGITTIGDGAFYGCKNLQSISLPAELSSLGNAAFSGCTAITEISFGRKISDIGEQAFYGCKSLLNFYVDDTNPFYKDLNGVLVHKKNNLLAFPSGRSGSYIVPDDIVKISSYAFAECLGITSLDLGSISEIGSHAFESSGLTSIRLPQSVQNLGDYTFYRCTSLASADLTNVSIIGDSVFRGCKSLTSVEIPSATSLGNQAFSDCTSLAYVNLPSCLTAVGDLAFAGCTQLIDFTVNSENKTFCVADGVLMNADATEIIAFPCGRTGSYKTPANITAIKNFAFFGCSLNDILLTNVSSVGRSAFADSNVLKNVSFSENLETLGDGAFDGCSSLTDISLPVSLTQIGQLTFRGCTTLSQITLPQNLEHIGQMAFADCTSLTEITLPDSVQYIDFAAFAGCSSLTILFSGKTEAFAPGWNVDNCPVVKETK